MTFTYQLGATQAWVRQHRRGDREFVHARGHSPHRSNGSSRGHREQQFGKRRGGFSSVRTDWPKHGGSQDSVVEAAGPAGQEAPRPVAPPMAGGYTFSFTAPSAGHLMISWYYVPKGAHLAKAKKPELVAAAGATFHHAGKAHVKLTLTGKGRKLLRGAKHLKLTTKARFAPARRSRFQRAQDVQTQALSMARSPRFATRLRKSERAPDGHSCVGRHRAEPSAVRDGSGPPAQAAPTATLVLAGRRRAVRQQAPPWLAFVDLGPSRGTGRAIAFVLPSRRPERAKALRRRSVRGASS